MNADQAYDGPDVAEDELDAPVSLMKADPQRLDLGWVELT